GASANARGNAFFSEVSPRADCTLALMPIRALRAAFALAALALSFSAAAATQATAPQGTPEPKHFLWEVSSMTNKVWLFGTIHAGKKEWFPLPAEIEEAFAASPVLAVEADVTNLAAIAKTAESMSYPTGE